MSMTAFPGGVNGKEPTRQHSRHETWLQSLGREDSPEEGMETPSSILACRIIWIEEPDGLQSKGLQTVRHDWNDLACTHMAAFALQEQS